MALSGPSTGPSSTVFSHCTSMKTWDEYLYPHRTTHVVDLNRIAFLMTGNTSEAPVTGGNIVSDYIPPLNTDIRVLNSKLIVQGTLTSDPTLPRSFDWRDPLLITKYKGEKIAKTPFVTVNNQYACGCAWALVPSFCTSDRFSILTGENIALSLTFLLSCNLSGHACSGGSPISAMQFLQLTGAPSIQCVPYTWCQNSSNCTHALMDTEQLNEQLLPYCADMVNQCWECIGTQCQATGGVQLASERWKIRTGSVQHFNGIDVIQKDIFTNGPLPGMFRVYADFIVGQMLPSKFPKADKWAKTNGIYVNVAGRDIYGYGLIPCCPNKPAGFTSDCYMGSHVVAITGWGIEEVPEFIQPAKSSTRKLPYWIVRNSWGISWGEQGYARIAWTNEQDNINTQLGLDWLLYDTHRQAYGGALGFLPDLTGHTPSTNVSKRPCVVCSPYITLVAILLSILIFALLLWFLILRK